MSGALLTCCAPRPSPPPPGLSASLSTTYSSSLLNLRRRRPRSQGDTPKRRCPVTSAKRREQPGKAVRGKEEEFPRGKPRERSSPSRERPDRTRGFSLAATRLRSSGPLRLRPTGTPGSRCDGSLDYTMNEGGKPQGSSNPVPWKSGSCYIPSPDRLWVGDAKRSQWVHPLSIGVSAPGLRTLPREARLSY